MKKVMALFLAAMMTFTLVGCGNGQNTPGEEKDGKESKYAQALDVLNEIVSSYEEADLFSIYGGDRDNAVMDAPGKFDISKTEELEFTLGLPKDLFDDIDDAASMVHMMNANTFTGAVYHLKDGTDMNDFADLAKNNILGQQWICGQPDTLVIIDAGGNYVITAYGEAGIMETFKNNTLSSVEGSQVITETPIS